MDVTCERCGTEYEFDETLLSGRGTGVKCTNCGHVFKVYPKEGQDAEQPESTWKLRRKDGSMDVIDSLRELQRRIGSGELTAEDEIARGDQAWKTLGSIPELETFFQAAGAPIASRAIPSPLPPPPVRGVPRPTSSSASPRRRPRQPTLVGVTPALSGPGGALGAEPLPDLTAARASEPAAASMPLSEPALQDESIRLGDFDLGADTTPAAAVPSSPPSSEIQDAEFEERPRALVRSSTRRSTPPPAYYDDDHDIPELPGRSWSPLRWVLVIVVGAGIALAATQWTRVTPLLGIGSDPAAIAAGIAQGDAALAEGHPQAYESAIKAYDLAIEAGGDSDPALLARLSHAHALAAQAQLDEGVTVDAVESSAAAARAAAARASELDPGLLDGKLAMADALRLSGEAAEARRLLEEVRSMAFSRTAEFFRIDAWISVVEADGRVESGLPSARLAAELSPRGVPYLLLLARTERAAGNEARARVPLETILADHPGHPVASKLLAELQAVEQVPDASIDADAGVPWEGGAEAAPEVAEPTKASEPAEATEPAEASEPLQTSETKATGAEATASIEPAAEAAKPTPAQPAATPIRKRHPAPSPTYDEYDRLEEAAGSDALAEDRPTSRDYEWYLRQGHAELAARSYARARASFERALEVRPGSAEAMDGLGHASIGLEDFDSALRYFRVAAHRGHPDGYFHLGRIFQQLGRNEEAISAYYTYLKRHPSGSHVVAARSAMKTLEPRAKLPSEPAPTATEESEQKSEPVEP
jgi:predicted Zn finger-like uncharacterized protein